MVEGAANASGVAIVPTPAPGSDNFLPLPKTTDIAALEAAAQANAVASSEYGGGTITFAPGDLIAGQGGSATDAKGNVWTLPPMTGQFAQLAGSMGQVTENGNPVDFNGAGGWVVALRIVNGQAVWENAKGIGPWWSDGLGIFDAANPPGPPDAGSSTGGLGSSGGSSQPPVTPPLSGGGSPPPTTGNTFIGANQSFTDAATGNKFRLDGELNAYETPKGGSEVSLGLKGVIGWNAEKMGDVNGTIYIQDSRDNSWHTFNGSTFSGAVADPTAGGGSPTPPPPPPPPPTGGGSTPPPTSGTTFIHANQSFTDAATGNKFRLDGELNAFETPKGGSEISLGTKGVIGWNAEAMGDVNGKIYIQDSRDNSWHTFNGSTFSGAVADPTGGGTTPPPPPPPPSGGGGSPPPPPPSSGAPAPAAAVGYNIEAFGGPMVLGQNMTGGVATGVTQNADGTMSISGGVGNHYNADLVTKALFGGGAYIQAKISFQNAPAGWTPTADGWPAFWGDPPDSIAADVGKPHVEPDFFEYETAGNSHQFQFGLQDWHADGSVTWAGDGGYGHPTTVNLPANFDPSQEHTYGFLWEPATATTQGLAEMFVDNVQMGPTYQWTQGSGPFSNMDTLPIEVIFGTGSANPMKVYDLQVWQKSTAQDVGVTPVTPPAGGGGSPPPPPPSGGGSPPPSGMTFIGGSQSFTDAATGNKFRLDGELNAYETPKGGVEVSLGEVAGNLGWNALAMGDVNGTIYIEDSRDMSWHTFSGGAFSGSVTLPAAALAAVQSTLHHS